VFVVTLTDGTDFERIYHYLDPSKKDPSQPSSDEREGQGGR
jgi:hypothetical protein